jgi:plastocyanin/uncharacterized membrane protein
MHATRIVLPGVMAFTIFAYSAYAASPAPASADRAGTHLILPLAHETGQTHGDVSEPTNHGTWHHFVTWVGHFHPPLTAFPIAMVLGAALAEFLRILRGPGWLDGASRWCMILGGASAAITAPLGWAFALEHEHSQLLEIHRWLGTAAGAGAVVLLVLSEIGRRRPGAMVLFRTILFLAVPLVMATGFFGGAMIYGIHEYAWSRSAGHDGDEAPEHEQPQGQPATSPATVALTVTMTDDDAFKPDKLTIPSGARVKWMNASRHTHTVTDDPKIASSPGDVSRPEGAPAFNSGKVRPGGAFEHTFTVPGVYKYVCEPHEDMDMKGQITVQAVH